MRRAPPTSKLYNERWRRARRSFLASHALCVMCHKEGVATLATVVDHITPHRGDLALFWNTANWQPLCTMHHNKVKQGIEHRGFDTQVDKGGHPTDPSHPWNKT